MREIAQMLLVSAQAEAANAPAEPTAWAPELHEAPGMEAEWETSARVLIVEDEPQLRRILARTMAADGFAVAEAGSLAGAHALLGGEPFGAAVLDVGLPDGDGLSLLAALPAERVVIVTANPDARVLAEAGPRRVLTKPVDLRELRSVVRRLASV